MKRKFIGVALAACSFLAMQAQTLSSSMEHSITLKTPGNPSTVYQLKDSNGQLVANENLPISIRKQVQEQGDVVKLTLTLQANDEVYYSLENIFSSPASHDACEFYMPGFWYHRNLRSPKEAPSFHTSDSWQVREDRLSTPLTGIYNKQNGDFYTVLRMDEFKDECLPVHTHGETILSGKTSLGYTGFRNVNGTSSLVFGFPYSEAPKTYVRKLTLAPAIQTFEKMDKGEKRELTWELRKGNAAHYSDFVADVWHYSYDAFRPAIVDDVMNNAEAKATLTEYFSQSYVDKYDLKYFSGVHIYFEDCISTGIAEVGFVGRVLLNAFNALEYGEANNRPDLVEKANAIFDSYLDHGFTPNGYFRAKVDFKTGEEEPYHSIRRQSEGVFAVLFYLEYERRQGRKHPEWEAKMKRILQNFINMQNPDGSFPRKFDDKSEIYDASGGSTPSATLPLVMAYKYFNNKTYLASAQKTAVYLEEELISKADYFSSTLDANCEDKEASLYASTAMYYLALVSKGKEQQHYIDLSKKSAYFALSWYYMWDVPFAQGQMLGDAGLQSRGWGNVSVENNHIDVFIFEFANVLDWLAENRNEPSFAEYSSVIKTSMLQLMPVEGHMYDIAKVGYYPEVVQHTAWDYGKNGKGFYNDLFAPGWTVASLWQMLSPERVPGFFNKKK